MLYMLQIPKVLGTYEGAIDSSSPLLILWENILMVLSVFILQSPATTISKTHLLKDAVEIFGSIIRQGATKVAIIFLDCQVVSSAKHLESMKSVKEITLILSYIFKFNIQIIFR